MRNFRLHTKEKIEAAIEHVYDLLQSQEITPAGKWDKARRFWLKNAHLVNVREPSRNWPLSQLKAGKTKKYVKAVFAESKPKTLNSLIKNI